jgi:hypothetical protein
MNLKLKKLLQTVGLVILVLMLIESCSQTETHSKNIGKNGVLTELNKKQVIVCSDVETYTDMYNSSKIGDKHEILALIQQGKIWEVPNGTKVLIIGYSTGLYQVRILDGKYAGYAGMVPDENVRDFSK